MRLVIDLQGAQGISHTRGIGRYSRELAWAMVQQPRGHEVVIALNGAMPDTAEPLFDRFMPLLGRAHVRTWFPPAPATTGEAAEIVRAQFIAALGPDLVHVTSVFDGMGDGGVIRSPSGLERLPMVATLYDLIPLVRKAQYLGTGADLQPHARWYYQRLHEMSLMDGLLAISGHSRREAVDHLGLDPSIVFNVGAGVGPAFQPMALDPAQRDALLRRHGLDGPFILFVGAGDVRKNEAALVDAYCLLPNALRNHQLMIVGFMADAPGLRHKLETVGCPQDRLVLAPSVAEEDLAPLYGACAVFVFPSLHEGFGLPAAEAMACGAPVIVSNTSSMPEVVGLAEATFDPTRPADIADRITAVLEDPSLRRRLTIHGAERAATMTWAAVAERAWGALENVHANGRGPAPTVLPPRRSLAFVSPLPPQQTGIADYSRSLLPALSRHYAITLVSEHGTTDDPLLQSAFPHLDMEAFMRTGSSFDRVLHQLGNSDFHSFQYRTLLPAYPGVAVLHDASLSGLANYEAYRSGRPDALFEDLYRSHGYPALLYAKAHGRDAAMRRFACCGPVLEQALWIIQHSRHAVSRSFEHAGADQRSRVSVIPPVAHMRPRHNREAVREAWGIGPEEFVVCTFGLIAPTKMPIELLASWRAVRGRRGRLVFVGAVDYAPEEVIAPADIMPLFTGRVDAESYDRWFAAADIAVQLRGSSQGETSAAVTDCLCFGLPVIVNEHGSACELPSECVLKVPEAFTTDALRDAIEGLRDDPARRTAMAQAGLAFASAELGATRVAERYRRAIERGYTSVPLAGLTTALAPSLPEIRNDGLRSLAGSIALSFPSGQRRLLLHEIDAEDSAFELGRALLSMERPEWRVETVRFDHGRLYVDSGIGARVIGHEGLRVAPRPVDPREGDVLLCFQPTLDLSDPGVMDLRRRCLAGTRVVLVLLSPGLQASAPGPSTDRLLSVADHVICRSRRDADDLAVRLDAMPGRRSGRLPIGIYDAVENEPPLSQATRFLACLNTGAGAGTERSRVPCSVEPV